MLGAFDGDLVGVFPFQHREDHAEIHACFDPGYRGAFAVNAAREAFRWVWAHTDYSLIRANIAARHAKRFAVMCGMTKTQNGYEVAKWAAL